MAAELGVSRQRLSALRGQPGFPEPIDEIAAGAIWDLDQVARWNDSGLRRPSGRPRGDGPTAIGGRYVLDERPIGSGGFADVYRATDLTVEAGSSHAVVAIKVLRELNDDEVRRRFMRELRLVGECRHPHIMTISDSGETEDGSLWFAMPLAKGSLAEDIDQFVGSDDRILRLMRQVCDALVHVHDKGIYHRDLKPGNILRTGGESWAVSDFGLAREAERTTTALTSTLQGVGTFFYAAPEAWSAAKYAGAPADIFSLGKVLQHLVTGELPVSSEAPEGRYRAVIERCIRQRPDQRYRSVSDLLDAIESAAAAPSRWTSPEHEADRLADGVRSDTPDEAAVYELGDMVHHASEPRAVVEALQRTIPLLSRKSIELLWERDPKAFVDLLDLYGQRVREIGWDFSFCDVIAEFFDRCVLVTKHRDVLRIAVQTLIENGTRHNRWHVRDVLAGILQRVRDADDALAAAEAIRDSSPSDVVWSITEFVARSLHPTIRDALENRTS